MVVGLPLSMNGRPGKQAEKVMAFVRKLEGSTQVPVELRDERLSTVAAARLMREGKKKRASPRQRSDAVAAAIILQGYLDEVRDSPE